MPFDTAGYVDGEVKLDDYLKRIGVTPVPQAQLLAHMNEQMRLNRPSLFATSKPFIGFGLLGCFGCLAANWSGGTSVAAPALVMLMLLCGLCAMAAGFFIASAVVMIGGLRLKGRAYWQQTNAVTYLDPTIPEPIREVVQKVRRTMPANALLIIGELIQNEAVIDPYVVVHLNGERACLGIWLDDKVIACAT